MEIYLRVFRYATGLPSKVIQFFAFSVVGILFSTVNIAMMIPLLDILFNQVGEVAAPVQPEFSLSINYLLSVFNHYFYVVIEQYGKADALLFVCLMILGSVLLTNIFRYLERMVASRVRVDITRNLRMDLFDKVTRLHIGYFSDQRKGDLISRMTNDVSEVEISVVNSMKSVLKEPLTIIVYFSVLFFISAKLTLITLVLLPVSGFFLAELIKRLKRKAKQSQESLGRFVNMLDETLGGMRVVKAFNARKYVLRKAEEESAFFRKVNLSIAYKNELSSPLSEFLGVAIVAGILFYGGLLVLNNESSLRASEFLTYLAVFAQIIQPAKMFSNGITSVQKGLASARRIFEVMDTRPAIVNRPGAQAIGGFRDAIEFHNVGFSYDREPVLRDVSVRIAKGKTIALVGPSGGGKSTLADLIPRFYDPTEGAIRIDGTDLRDVDLDSLRRLMGVVTQESILFNDTIFNNIAFGMETASDADVIRAAKVANAHDFIMETENGYQTVIGERGTKLSGGQRQRLSIARAVLKNPPILILDEATSALDSESERLVQDALAHLMENRTSVVIAHRLSTIQHADEILVIQGGAIVERGTHDQLLAQGGLYRKLNELQKA
jgi:subfamily B ATP-binding cassette protein MsbA